MTPVALETVPKVRNKAKKILADAKKQVIKELKRHEKLAKDDDNNGGQTTDDLIGGISLEEIKKLTTVAPDLETVGADGGNRFLAELALPGRDDLFGQVNERAVAYARARAAELVTDIDDVTRSRLKDIIAGGLADNVGLDGIIDKVNADESGLFDEDRADLIARTEVAAANGNGSLEGMRLAQKAGVKLKKIWIPDDLACDECLDNGDAGPIDLDENFPTGDDAPPAHPNCRCDMASEIEEEEQDEDGTDDDE